VDECKPLAQALGDWTTQRADPQTLLEELGDDMVKRMAGQGDGQGLTLVHFSAQPEPFLRQEHTLGTP